MRSGHRNTNLMFIALALLALACCQLAYAGQSESQPKPILTQEQRSLAAGASQGSEAHAIYAQEGRSFDAAPPAAVQRGRSQAALAVSRSTVEDPAELIDRMDYVDAAARARAAKSGAQPKHASADPRFTSTGLQLGVPVSLSVSLPPVYQPTLFAGDYGHRVVVPGNATKLEVTLATTTPNVKVNLYLRFGKDVDLIDGQVLADHSAEGPGGDKKIVVTTASSRPLLPGNYYIAFGVFTAGTSITGTVTALADGEVFPPGSEVKSGVPANLFLPAVYSPTLFTGDYGYRIAVPQWASKLEIDLAATNPNVHVNLYVRFGRDVELSDGRVIADHVAEGSGGNKRIVVTPSTWPVLRPGTYYIAFGVFTTGTSISGTITATIDRQVPKCDVRLPEVYDPTLFAGDYGCRVVVPSGATRLEINLATFTTGVRVDLYVRLGRDIDLSAGRPVADYLSEGPGGNKTIVVTQSSWPPLQAGTYYIGFGLFTTGTPVYGTVTYGAVEKPPTMITCEFSLPSVDVSTLFTGWDSCRIPVPQDATRLELHLETATANAQVALYARFGQDVDLSGGYVVADHISPGKTGNETIVVTPASSPALRAGTYYLGLGLFTKGMLVSGKVTATVSR
jgi:hypothetical protein